MLKFCICLQLQVRKRREQTRRANLYDQEDILGGVGDGEDGGAGQGGDSSCLDVRTQHGFGLLRIQVKEKVL